MADKPDQTLDVTVDDKPYTLTMWFGLLNRLVKKLGTPDQALIAVFDDTKRDEVLQEVLTKRGKSGVFDKYVVDSFDISSEDVARIMTWVGEHVLDFFLQAAERIKAAEENIAPRNQALMQSSDGTPA